MLVALFRACTGVDRGNRLQAIRRIIAPEPLPGKIISIVAAGGIVINTITALLFLRNKDHDLNIKSAFLHLWLMPLYLQRLLSVAFLFLYNLYWIDAALSLLVAAVILVSTWNLLRDSLRLSLDAVPEGSTSTCTIDYQ